MRRVPVARSAYLLTVLAAACSGQTTPKTSDQAMRSAVDNAANRLLAALRTDAADSLLALMADDVVIMPPNEPVLRGKAAVQQHTAAEPRESAVTLNRGSLGGTRSITESG